MDRSKKSWVHGIILLLPAWVLTTAAFGAIPPDSTIKLWVQNAMTQDPHTDAAHTQVEVSQGIVTLSGTVDDLAGKNYAELDAKKIDGVRGVIDKLVVVPEFRWDADIILDVRQRIVWDPTMETDAITVGCTDGMVTLTGTVSSWSEKDEAGLLATEVRGVKGVRNDLVVKWKMIRPDSVIQKDIMAALRRDAYLTDLPIEVSVTGGYVTLTGTVGSEYEKERASYNTRRVDNVMDVNNNLNVEWWDREGARAQRPMPNDEDLRQTVTAELTQDSRVNATEVAVTALLGHVTLTGTVPTFAQKQIAEADAKDVVGVAWVSNDLLVGPVRRSDSNIRDDILASIGMDEALWDQGITVRVNNGIVILLGTVNRGYDRLRASTVAGRIRGVKGVVDNLTVNWDREYRDGELMLKIADRIKTDFLLVPAKDRIKVTVDQGRVTLTGTVYNWGERREADRITSETPGVRSIDNRLEVQGYNYAWSDGH
jgi:osmotically-inducible protein OsmY